MNNLEDLGSSVFLIISAKIDIDNNLTNVFFPAENQFLRALIPTGESI